MPDGSEINWPPTSNGERPPNRFQRENITMKIMGFISSAGIFGWESSRHGHNWNDRVGSTSTMLCKAICGKDVIEIALLKWVSSTVKSFAIFLVDISIICYDDYDCVSINL